MSQSSIANNRQIAKNAIALYFRMAVTMLVGLYASRVILNALGVSDYGIYGVVGGFVSMFTLISSSLSASISRFLTFELGRGNAKKLKAVFSNAILALIGIAIIVVIAAETVGLWYLYNKMVIPADRINAAFWCFQLSLLTLVISLINMPYSASIIAHERMDIYAYLAVSDAVLKLAVCFAVLYSTIDRLILYASLLCAISILNQCIYVLFCKQKFAESKFEFKLDKSLFKALFSFAGWNFIGNSAAILTSQGSNLLLNWAGGPVVNAAYGIANSASGMVSSFVGNFTQAFNPQITKRYAAEEYASLMTLLVYGSKYSYFLMYIIALPILLNTHFLLKLWLGQVPEYTIWFIRFIILANLFDTISRPIVTAKNATGRIKNYQIIVGGILLLTLPLSYFALKLGCSVISVTVIAAIIAFVAVFARMYMLRGDFPGWSSAYFIKKVVIKVLLISVLSTIVPLISYILLPYGTLNFLMTSTISLLSCAITIYWLGCEKPEKEIIRNKTKIIWNHLKNQGIGK